MEHVQYPPMSGFDASLRGTSLPEFIQVTCASRARAIYRVRSRGRTGYVFLDGGDVVHAVAAPYSGTQAAFAMLEWEQGTIEPCTRPWPRAPSFRMSPQALLLQAAYHYDEKHRNERGELISLAERRSVPEPAAPQALTGSPDDPGPRSHDAPLIELLDDATVTDGVIVDADGSIIAGTGPEQEELAGIVSYVAMLADLVGEALGLEQFQGLDATIGRQDCIVRRTDAGWGIALAESGTAATVEWSSP